jgi:hypothetical protein
MFKAFVASIFLFFCAVFNIAAQTTYLQIGHEDYQLLDRLETKSGRLSNQLFLFNKPASRKGLVNFLVQQQSDSNASLLSEIDRYNIEHAISTSGEWTADENGAIDSKRPILKHFYKKQPDLVYVKTDDFFLSANPVITASFVAESNNSDKLLMTSHRGAEVRGWVAKKLGFYTFFTDNQEQLPSYIEKWSDEHRAVPGGDFFTKKGKTYEYFQARGYIDFAVLKDYINVTAGYDKQFLGDGMRSLFLSDFSANNVFLRINTRIWKLNYQNNFFELIPQFTSKNSRRVRKYATMHTLSINATNWLNVGLFESIIFARPDRYEFSYMVPILFYRQIERSLGSPDNAMIGINFKALAAKRLQFYGQLLFDEFTIAELKAGRGYWANKFAVQLGAKYFDVAGIKNLDIQGELNLVRPYTYTHFDTIANYTHYNQPLAHPLEASFAEVMGIVRYQPVKNLYLSLKANYYNKGADTGKANYGGDIFRDYDTRSENYGVSLVNGVKTSCAILDFNASYELRENLFFDLGTVRRVYNYEGNLLPGNATAYVYGGLRLNFVRRDYTFY